MPEEKRKRGRPPGTGKPLKSEEEKLTSTFLLRLTESQKQKLNDLGGSEWVRERIDRAR